MFVREGGRHIKQVQVTPSVLYVMVVGVSAETLWGRGKVERKGGGQVLWLRLPPTGGEEERWECNVWCGLEGGVPSPKKATSVFHTWGRELSAVPGPLSAVLHIITCRRLDLQHGQRGEFLSF